MTTHARLPCHADVTKWWTLSCLRRWGSSVEYSLAGRWRRPGNKAGAVTTEQPDRWWVGITPYTIADKATWQDKGDHGRHEPLRAMAEGILYGSSSEWDGRRWGTPRVRIAWSALLSVQVSDPTKKPARVVFTAKGLVASFTVEDLTGAELVARLLPITSKLAARPTSPTVADLRSGFEALKQSQRMGQPLAPAAETFKTISVSLLNGSEDLQVVGESFHQDNLWRVVGEHPDEYVRCPVTAVLVPEYDNPHDPNAIAVHIMGLAVGHLPRELASLYRKGLVALQDKSGMPVALSGNIFGGGQRDDGIGKLGVFLTHDPADFGVLPAPAPEPSVRTGASELAGRGHLRWRARVYEDDVRAIRQLRRLLTTEKDPIDRHFIFSDLEHRLYRCRDVFPTALDDYDTVCRDHDAEMEAVVPLLVDALGGVPLLETYRQAAIRQDQAKHYALAAWWSERGLALYGDRAFEQEWAEDLRKRAQRCQAKVGRASESGPAAP